MTVPVAVDRERVDGVHGVPCGDERTDQEPPVELDADHDLCRILGVCRNHLVQLRHPLDPIGHTALGQ